MAIVHVRYAAMPEDIRNNLTEDQFELARVDIVAEGDIIQETTEYIDLGSGMRKIHHKGDIAPGNLLPTHDLSGAFGEDNSQWES